MRNISKSGQQNSGKLIVLNIVVLAAIVVGVVLCSGYFAISKALEEDTFAQGVTVNGIEMGGKTLQEGRTEVVAALQDQMDAFDLEISFNGATQHFNAEDFGVRTDAAEVVDAAFAVGKNKTMLENYYETAQTKQDGTDFLTQLSVDEKAIAEQVSGFLEAQFIAPVDATASLNKATHKMEYTSSSNGFTTDASKVSGTVIDQTKRLDDEPVFVQGETVVPELTTQKLKENSVKIGECTTIAANNEARNTNINLMCEAVNGLTLQPGETLSINELVGERTEEKGFKKAPAIMDGKRLVDDLGGGICQLSGTLYNAALLANMEIVERVRHSFPSAYLPIGLDSTLNWDDKDLKIKNTSEYPMYLSANFEGQEVKVEIFGQPLPDGMEIVIEPVMLKETPPKKAEIEYTSQLPAGVTKTVISSRKGYDVDVYRIYYQNGAEVKRELLSQDRYPAVTGLIQKGSGEAK